MKNDISIITLINWLIIILFLYAHQYIVKIYFVKYIIDSTPH